MNPLLTVLRQDRKILTTFSVKISLEKVFLLRKITDPVASEATKFGPGSKVYDTAIAMKLITNANKEAGRGLVM